MSVQMFFVIPAGCKTKEECAPIMLEAYNSVVANDIKAKWVTEIDANIDKGDKNYYIFQKFNGEFYQKILNLRNIKILSALCLLQCVTQFKPIPNSGTPLLSLALHNCIVVCSSLPKECKKDLKSKVESMAGLYSAPLVSNTTYLIANDVKSEKYKVAARTGMKIMTLGFIDALWEASKSCAIQASDFEYEKYKCPVFMNLQVCSTGFAKNETQVQTLVTAHGGLFSSTLDVHKTDVLVCKSVISTSSAKFKAAIKRNIDCVTVNWILDSVEKKYALLREDYGMTIATSTPAEDDIAIAPYVSQMSMINVISSQQSDIAIDQTDETVNSILLAEKRIDSNLNLLSLKPLTESTLKESSLAIFAGLHFVIDHYSQPEEDFILEMIKEARGTVVDATYASPNYLVVPIKSTNMSNDPALPVVTHLWVTDCIEQKQLIDEPEYYHVPFTKSADVLSGTCISTSGFGKCEKEFLSYVVTQLGGVHQDWMARNAIAEKNTLATTHLIAEEPSGKKFNGARKWKIPIVHKKWLLRCAEEGRRLAEDAFLINTNNDTANDGSKRRKLCVAAEVVNNSLNMTSQSSPVNTVAKKWITDLPTPSQRKSSGALSEIKRKLTAKYYTNSCTSEAQDLQLPNDIPPVASVSLPVNAENSSTSLTIDINTNNSDNELNKMAIAQIDELEAYMKETVGNNAKRRSARKRQSDGSNAKMANGRISPVLSVVWDDNMVVPTLANHSAERRRLFMISNVDMEPRNLLVRRIETLNADVSASTNFDPSATHLLCEQLNRNEKLLGSMASGLWILHISYVADSAAAGRFLNEEDYEFGNPRAMSKFDIRREFLRRAAAAYYWREELGRRGQGAFQDIRAIVFANKREAMVRVLQAGGATIVEASPPFAENIDATYCFIELKNNDVTPYIPLAQQGILCVNTLYVNDFLHRISQDFNDFIIPALRKYYR